MKKDEFKTKNAKGQMDESNAFVLSTPSGTLSTHSFILFSKASLYLSFANSFFLSISSLDPSNLAGIGSGSASDDLSGWEV